MKHKIEEAKTSRASCKNPRCKRKIKQGEAKLMIETFNGFSPSGTQWKAYCSECGLPMLEKEYKKLGRSIEKLQGNPVPEESRPTISTVS